MPSSSSSACAFSVFRPVQGPQHLAALGAFQGQGFYLAQRMTVFRAGCWRLLYPFDQTLPRAAARGSLLALLLLARHFGRAVGHDRIGIAGKIQAFRHHLPGSPGSNRGKRAIGQFSQLRQARRCHPPGSPRQPQFHPLAQIANHLSAKSGQDAAGPHPWAALSPPRRLPVPLPGDPLIVPGAPAGSYIRVKRLAATSSSHRAPALSLSDLKRKAFGQPSLCLRSITRLWFVSAAEAAAPPATPQNPRIVSRLPKRRKGL